MKKILLATTALVTAFAFNAVAGDDSGSTSMTTATPPVANANPWRPELKISGEGKFSYYNFRNKNRSTNGGKGYGHHFSFEDTRVNFEAVGNADSFFGLNGTEYGFLLAVTAERDRQQSVEEARLKVKNSYGTAMFGNTNGVEDYSYGANNIMGGTGGVYGNYTNVVNKATGVITTNDPTTRTRKGTKVNLFTPRFAGFQLGVSYTPDTKHEGAAKVSTINNNNTNLYGTSMFDDRAFGKTSWAGNLNFNHTFQNGFDAKVSVTGMTENSGTGYTAATATNNATINDGRAWQVGGEFSYAGVTLAGDYLDNRKSRVPGSTPFNLNAGGNHFLNDADAGKVYTVALAYELGTHKVSVGYMHSDRKMGRVSATAGGATAAAGDLGKAKATVWSATYDKQFAPGWAGYVEYVNFSYKSTDNAATAQTYYKGTGGAGANNSSLGDGVAKNNGHVVIIGTKVKF